MTLGDGQSILWDTDYVPLVPSGFRLAGTSVLLFAAWSEERNGGLLAIATKSNILLYETPKGE